MVVCSRIHLPLVSVAVLDQACLQHPHPRVANPLRCLFAKSAAVPSHASTALLWHRSIEPCKVPHVLGQRKSLSSAKAMQCSHGRAADFTKRHLERIGHLRVRVLQTSLTRTATETRGRWMRLHTTTIPSFLVSHRTQQHTSPDCIQLCSIAMCVLHRLLAALKFIKAAFDLSCYSSSEDALLCLNRGNCAMLNASMPDACNNVKSEMKLS